MRKKERDKFEKENQMKEGETNGISIERLTELQLKVIKRSEN